MATTYSSDLLGTARTATAVAVIKIDRVRDNDLLGYSVTETLDSAEAYLTQALAEVRAARWGVERRMPNFDSQDLNIVLDAEQRALRHAAGVIPGAHRVAEVAAFGSSPSGFTRV